MISFPSLLVSHAQNAGIVTPLDIDNYSSTEYPYYFVYQCVQIGCPIVGNSHIRNAEIIAAIPQNKITKITFGELKKLGVV